jgi:tetratricopeptide (TPR) repeat protein
MRLKLLLILLCTVAKISFCQANDSSAIDKNISAIENYYLQDNEALPYDEVVVLSTEVIQNRHLYSNDILGKVFILLADAATNKGEDATAFQFAQDGLTLNGIDNKIKLNLLLKIAAGYYIKGKYQQTLKISSNVIVQANHEDELNYRLIALSFRAVASALLNESSFAFSDLEQVEQLLDENPKYANHLKLLEILATAHYYLGEFQVALTMQQKLLKMRFDLGKINNIDRTYYHLARAYQELGQLDDAYNAFWQAKKYSIEKKAPIRIAYAELGLGEMLIQQKEFQAAYDVLQTSKEVFQGGQLARPYLSSLILLAKAAIQTERHLIAIKLLEQAEVMAKDVSLTLKQIELYKLLSDMYQEQGQYKKALVMQSQYIEMFENYYMSLARRQPHNIKIASDKSQALVLNLAELSTLRAQFTQKFEQQREIIVILSMVVISAFLFFIFYRLRVRSQRINQIYDEVEQPSYFLANAYQTKKMYQLNYKMARKHVYPLAVGYLSVTNWQELDFNFNKRIMKEISTLLATLINETISEFDHAGLINEGEYLLLCPYQTVLEIEEKLKAIRQAVKVSFFANLGDYSVKIAYAFDVPNIQDIDPYIFLSRLSEATKA